MPPAGGIRGSAFHEHAATIGRPPRDLNANDQERPAVVLDQIARHQAARPLGPPRQWTTPCRDAGLTTPDNRRSAWFRAAHLGHSHPDVGCQTSSAA